MHIPAGRYVFAVHRLGFQAVTALLDVKDGDTLRPAFMLTESPIGLAPVTIRASAGTARLREFDARRALGFGEFWTQAMIESRHAVSTVDVLRESQRLRVVPSGAKLIATSGRQWTSCPMQVYVDAVALAGPGNEPLDLNQLPSPAEILGIEIYSGPDEEPISLTTGPRAGTRSCGAILVWTKDGSER